MRDDLAQMGELASLRGRVTASDWSGAPIVVAVLRRPEREGAPFAIVDFQQLFRPGEYAFLLDPGTYRVVAFVDENRDLDFQPDERLAPYDDFREIVLAPGRRDGVDVAISGAPAGARERMPEVAQPTGDSRQMHVGEVLPLRSERFGPEAGRMGALEPVRFMRELGAGVFLLEPHDASRTPVLFVHGISGYPQEFEAMIAGLDRARFEPWVAQYPSGWALDEVAARLHRVMNELQTSLAIDRMCIVAHSMGGVVTRRALAYYAGDRPAPFVRGLVTIASPLGGHPGAGAGVAMSPIVVPAWRDLVPTGDFVAHLYDSALPEETRYALFFAYVDPGGGDGVVPLSSQLRVEAAREADVVRGFVGTHVGVLRQEVLSAALAEELERCRGDL